MAIIKRAVAPAAVKEEEKTDVVKINPPVTATVSGSEVGKKPVEKKEEVKKEEPAAKKAETEKKAEPVKKEAAAKKPAAKKPAAKKPAAKKPAAKKTTAAKKAAPAKSVKTSLTIQFGEKEITRERIDEIFKDVWKYDYKRDIKEVKSVNYYFKTEESAVYFVTDDGTDGKLNV